MSKKEVNRQLFHILIGLIIVLYLQLYGAETVTRILGTLLVVGLVLSFTSKKIKLPVVKHFLTAFDREEDLKRFPGRGAITFVLGSLISVLLFDTNIASATIIILATLDSFSTLGGLRFGKTNHPLHHNKTIEGSLFGFLISFFAALLFVTPFKALIACFLATAIEMMDLKIDDNILIPLVAGIALMIPI